MIRTLQIRCACVALAATLSACTSVKPMMAPSGAQGFRIWCEMPSQCYERAAQQCPSGYVIEANEKDYWGLGDVDGNLFIVCKKPGDAPTPVPNGGTPQSQPTTELDPSKRCDACQKIGKP